MKVRRIRFPWRPLRPGRPPMPPPAALTALLAVLLPPAPTGAAPASAAQEKAQERIEPWLGDFDGALQRALERNVPLMILSILEGEVTSDRVRDEIYHGKEFLQASQGAIVLLTNGGTHASEEIEVELADGRKVVRRACSRYGTPTCLDHQRSQDRVYQEFHMDGDFKMPHLIALLPGGKIHGRAFDEIQIGDAVRLAKEAKEAAGPALSEAELVEVQTALQQLAAFEKARVWTSAWRAGTRVLAITAAPVHAGPAQAGVDRALAGMRGDVEHALGLLERGEVETGYLKLLALRAEHADTPLEKETRDTLRKVERDDRYEDAIEAVQHKLEAEEIWAKVEEALAAGKERLAERHARKLLERYADTPAGKRAAERFPELLAPGGAAHRSRSATSTRAGASGRTSNATASLRRSSPPRRTNAS